MQPGKDLAHVKSSQRLLAVWAPTFPQDESRAAATSFPDLQSVTCRVAWKGGRGYRSVRATHHQPGLVPTLRGGAVHDTASLFRGSIWGRIDFFFLPDLSMPVH